MRFWKSPHFKNYGSFAAFVVFMFDVILIHFSISRHKGTRSINILEVTNVFSTEQRNFYIFNYYGLGVSRPECEKLKFKPSSQLNWSPYQKGIQNRLLAWFWI